MYRAAHITTNRTAHDIAIGGTHDIAEVLRQRHIESLSAHDDLDFWFSPSLITTQRLNIFATDLLLLASTRYGASSVPLLYGDIVVAAHNPSGALADLTKDHLERLRAVLGWHREWILNWRYDFAERRARSCAKSRVCAHAEGIHRAF